MDILDPDVSYSEPTTIRDRAILAIWIILWISLAGAGIIIVFAMPASAAEINPSVDNIPFQCRFTYTKWLCDDSAGPAGARGINGTPGTPGASNFSAIYYNASNFTAYQNTTLIFGNITTGNNTINSNYTYIQGATFFNSTSINESYAYLPGRSGGQVLTGGTGANDDLILNGTSSTTKTTSYVLIQPDGGNVGIGTKTPLYTTQIRRAGTHLASMGIELDGLTTAGKDVGFYSVSDSTSDYTGYAFYGRDGTADDNIRLSIAKHGRIGIGTLAPTSIFEIRCISAITEFELPPTTTDVLHRWGLGAGHNSPDAFILYDYSKGFYDFYFDGNTGYMALNNNVATKQLDINGNLRIRGIMSCS